MSRATREAYGQTLVELVNEGHDIVAVDADLAGSTKLADLQKAFPQRMVDVGIAEQNMVGVASGLSLTGRTVFTGSFAVFATGRAYDQIRNTVCDSGLNVKICPTHAGITVGEDGATHQSLEESVAVEEGGIGSPLLVRSVVGGEDHDGVLVQALLLEFVENLSDIGVETRDHGRKLRMGDFGAVVAVAKLACELVLLAEMVLVGEEDAIFGLREFGVREGVGEDAEEGLRAALLVEPFHGLVVDEVGGVLRALGVVGLGGHAVLDVFLEDNAVRLGVACRTAEGVEEVGIISVGLELTDVAKVFVDAALVGRGDGRFVASGPFAEHAGGVAVGFEDFGQNLVVHVIGFLSGPSVLEVGILAVEIGHALVAPIFFVATHVGVSAVLSGHECGARRCGDGATGIGLRETHAFGGHAVDTRGRNVLLSVATEIAVAHVVTHDVDDVGALLRMG